MTDEKSKEAPAGAETARDSVSDEELRAAFSGPAVRSNKIYLSMTDSGIRIAFMEQHGTSVPPIFRLAVSVSFPDAFALRDLIARQLDQIEGLEAGFREAIETAKSEAKKDDGE